MREPDDLGLLNATRPIADVVSGGQPTPAQLRAAGDAGYKTVLTTRSPVEILGYDERADVEGAGMAYVEFPIASAADFTRENVAEFARLVEAAEKPLLIHCGSGNRIGALFALEAGWLKGASADDALARGRECGLQGLAGHVAALLQS